MMDPEVHSEADRSDPGGMTELTVGNRRCFVFRRGEPEFVVVRPIGTFEMDGLSRELASLEPLSGHGFLFAASIVEDWNDELSPWDADPPRGRDAFGHGARDTLDFIMDDLLPSLDDVYGTSSCRTILAGYSLAGLFSLWSGMVSERFDAVVGASASVWFPGWQEFVSTHAWNVDAVYLSLGDTEHLTRNAMLSSSRDRMEGTYRSMDGTQVRRTLVWNRGGHFQDCQRRVADGVSWAMSQFTL